MNEFFSHSFFQIFNYLVFVFSLIAYATLDGFDLGVGCMHLLVKEDRERRLMINAIGPVWDGNTTWIVIGGGILFAAFPRAFSTIMEGLYLPVMFLLFAYMTRGAAIEFRSKKEEKGWRSFWDIAFFIASFLVAFDISLALGNLIQGVPIDQNGHLRAPLLSLFTPYPLLISGLGLSLFIMHGNIYLLMKTEGKIYNQLRKRAKKTVPLFFLFWIAATIATFFVKPHMIDPFFKHPILLFFPFLSFCAIFAIPYFFNRKKDGLAFVASCSSIASLLILFVIGTFPYFVYGSTEPSLTLFNSSSTKTALMILAFVSLTGVPLSFFYGSYIYRVFRGKVKLDPMSY
jgi:cytochrome bd ubiquinol oxidase subunit II